MIYTDKVYIPVVRGCSVWSVSEIDTAKAKKTPSYIVPGYIQYNGGLYSAGNVFCPLLMRGTGSTFSVAIAAKCTLPPRSVASGR